MLPITKRFKNTPGKKYAWFSHEKHGYDPFVFHLLSIREKDVLQNWYEDTDKHWPHGAGACGYTAISAIAGILLGCGIQTLVQCGHYAGYSTLLLGMMFRFMGKKNSLYTIDIRADATEYTQVWVKRAGLSEYIECVLGDSSDESHVDMARRYFGGGIETVFIDSSHRYDHTVEELSLWYDALDDTGFIFLHDVSEFAKRYDKENQDKGVQTALTEFQHSRQANAIIINRSVPQGKRSVYTDPCGLGIIQKT